MTDQDLYAILRAIAEEEDPCPPEEAIPRIIIDTYCPNCQDGTRQVFIGDRGIYEEYRCEVCKGIHHVAVR